ncbi:hypothetical protein [Nocardioides stalactiti]|uniref:hypothetical protein n=1 Tax=Nocardioides stalactiti TaxID=2755356 RepID=UPI001602C0F4|nr:hypothetical protein [Nocardioides stalactiti]
MITSRTTRTVLRAAAVLAVGMVTPLAFGIPQAAAADRDHDGMPDRWERRHGLDPRVDDARRDLDRDGLRNIAEWRKGVRPEDEDTDGDGDDDGDEVTDGVPSTDVDDPDTDDDGTPDGDEDADGDDTDNEDEDDADESCRRDDDDHDGDHVDDEDENELGLSDDDSDSDDDGVEDGDDDSDDDGEADEDDDDSLDDRCGRDDDEDVDDLVGTILSFEESTGTLVVDRSVGDDLLFLVTDDTEIEIETDDSGPGDGNARRSDEEGSTDDLLPGVLVKEVDIDDDVASTPPTLEEIEIYGVGAGPDEPDDD